MRASLKKRGKQKIGFEKREGELNVKIKRGPEVQGSRNLDLHVVQMKRSTKIM